MLGDLFGLLEESNESYNFGLDFNNLDVDLLYILIIYLFDSTEL